MKEPKIKLFGKKIPFLENGGVATASAESSAEGSNGGAGDCYRCLEVSGGGGDGDKEKQLQVEQDQAAGKPCETISEDKNQDPGKIEVSQNPSMTLESEDNPKTPQVDEDVASANHPKTETEQNDASNGQQKTLKKPDKILPCPRCNSMDTKFCYYNNYNVNQPRHFCKSCQRYWTDGGTMRNVPVGAGRRKNKISPSHCGHITISKAVEAARIDAPKGFHPPAHKPHGTVLSFGPNSTMCEPLMSALNLADGKIPNGGSIYHKGGENGDDYSVGSSVTTSNSMMHGEQKGSQHPLMQNIDGFQSPVPCIPGIPWPLPWNPAAPIPTICSPPAYPMSFYSPPYWNCVVPNAWNVPWLPVPSQGTCSSPGSPLGKHSRNGELISQKNSESSIVVPKLLRIDDPEEAVKSSIWETLGIKYDPTSREGLFKALQPKGDEKKQMISSSLVLQANPAALSRSIVFQEGI